MCVHMRLHIPLMRLRMRQILYVCAYPYTLAYALAHDTYSYSSIICLCGVVRAHALRACLFYLICGVRWVPYMLHACMRIRLRPGGNYIILRLRMTQSLKP